MNNSELFKSAHKLARKNVAQIGDYRLAFKWALSEVKAEAEKPRLTLGQKITYSVEQSATVIGHTLMLIFFVLVFGFLSYWPIESGEVIGVILGSASLILGVSLSCMAISEMIWSLKENHRIYFR